MSRIRFMLPLGATGRNRDTVTGALKVIRGNLVAAFAYNAVCIPLAAAGYLSPVLASAAMSLSSVSVLLSSLRLRRWLPARGSAPR